MPTRPLPQAQPRLLAIDVGSRRTGVALSDELGLFAHPRPALLMPPSRAVAAVATLAADEAVAEIIVGLPVTMAGGDSQQTRDTRQFITALRAAVSVPVREWDERLSSVQATRTATRKLDRATGERDSAAAALILQAVLDARRNAAP